MVVTGVAGFVGSHLAERLVSAGHQVTGIDCFTPYYDVRLKRANLADLDGNPRFRLLERDLGRDALDDALAGAEVIFHQAAQAGVRASWGASFAEYTHHNVLGTQRLLEAALGVASLRKLVYASSSSVYGNAPLPMDEDARPQPVSPYGVTKLAAEHLCLLYAHNYDLPVACLRYFTVYGPRQRPDMGFHKFVEAVLAGRPIPLYGDGTQTRDFTYVSDIVDANLAAAACADRALVVNVGGGSRVPLRRVFELIGTYTGREILLDPQGAQRGDVGHTVASTARAQAHLGFVPGISIDEGLRRQVAWHMTTLRALKGPA